ncbi:hypothetical protein [Bifidobacterium scaligerum]|uniref:Ethanolamine utilization protein EutL n=1 Tax=Bifidobacterium scaligerum TaxID=2052656 RepID=A0A2M9HQC0_9BIFI|nr:hypothetical protein [Bifidobacterium scaligerum]PJM79030.1 hypothetical protein CUU80_06745 [Bifidobacterium scaligerum]
MSNNDTTNVFPQPTTDQQKASEAATTALPTTGANAETAFASTTQNGYTQTSNGYTGQNANTGNPAWTAPTGPATPVPPAHNAAFGTSHIPDAPHGPEAAARTFSGKAIALLVGISLACGLVGGLGGGVLYGAIAGNGGSSSQQQMQMPGGSSQGGQSGQGGMGGGQGGNSQNGGAPSLPGSDNQESDGDSSGSNSGNSGSSSGSTSGSADSSSQQNASGTIAS